MHNKTLKIHPKDNVIVALTDLKKDEIINPLLKLKNNVKAKHKFSIENLSIGDSVFMYGVVVGKAKKRILKGEQISPFNIVHETEDYKIPKKVSKTKWNPPSLDEISKKTFLGYHREDGKVGTENNWLIIPLVFCQNRNIEKIKKNMIKSLGYSNLDDEDYNLNELIEKYKKGDSEEDILKTRLIQNSYKNKTNPLIPYDDGIHF